MTEAKVVCELSRVATTRRHSKLGPVTETKLTLAMEGLNPKERGRLLALQEKGTLVVTVRAANLELLEKEGGQTQ